MRTPVMNQKGTSIIEMMVAMMILGIVIAGNIDGMRFLMNANAASNDSVEAQQAIEQALFSLESIPYTSVLLADDGDPNDLGDLVAPDKKADPATGATPWIITVNNHAYTIVYNIAQDAILRGTKVIYVYAVWAPLRSDQSAPGGTASGNFHVFRSIVRGQDLE